MTPTRNSHLAGLLFLFLIGPGSLAAAQPQAPGQTRSQAQRSAQKARKQAPKQKKGAKSQAPKPNAKGAKGASKAIGKVEAGIPRTLQNALPLSQAETVARFDRDGNRRLNALELSRAKQEEEARRLVLNRLLRTYDSDKNGKIEGSEARQLMGDEAADRRRKIELKYDIDQDGLLEPQERAAMLRDLEKDKQGSPKAGLSKADRHLAATKKAEQALKMRFDSDKSGGELSPQEQQAYSRFVLNQRIAAARKERGEETPAPQPLAKNEPGPAPSKSQGERPGAPKPTPSAKKPGPSAKKPAPAGQQKPAQSKSREATMKRFDLNKDSKLSPSERKALAEHLEKTKQGKKKQQQAANNRPR